MFTHAVRPAAIAAALVLCVSACRGGIGSGPTRPPRIAVGEATHDFGRVTQGETVAYSYTVRNAGGLDLRIDKVRTSCGCTAAMVSRPVIRPGGEGLIRVSFDSQQSVGRITRTISVYTNDPAHPVTALRLTGAVETDVAAQPAQLYVGRVQRGRPASPDVKLRLEHDFAALTPVAVGERVLDASLLESDAAATPARVHLAVRRDAPLGPFKERVTVYTGRAQRPALTVPVAGVVEGDVTVAPPALHFGSMASHSGATQSVMLRNHGARPVRILSAEVAPPIGRAEIVTVREGEVYRIRLALLESETAGPLRGTLELETDHPEQRHISVPFSGQLAAAF